MNIVGPRVKQARKEQRLTQTELAAQLQLQNVVVEQKAISRIENKMRMVADYELWALSKILKHSVEWFLEGEEK